MIKTLLIEDELLSREFIRQLIKDRAPFIEVIGETGSVDGAIKLINDLRPQLVIADIQLNGQNAFDIFRKISSFDFQVVFVTAFENFAIPALKLSAADYILKPISPSEFGIAMEKVAKKVNEILYTEENVQGTKKTSNSTKLIISDYKEIHVVLHKDIIYLEAHGSYTSVVLRTGKKITSSKSISEYEDALANVGFYRVHKSYIINMLHATKYVKGRGGEVIMTNGDKVLVSTRKKDNFLTYLGN